MAKTDGKANPGDPDPDKMMRLFEIEFEQKRAHWRRTADHRRTWRAAAFLFLIAIIVGSVAAYFLIVANGPRVDPLRRPVPTPLPSP